MRLQDLALRLLGSTSGEQILKTAAAASGAITLPSGTTDFSATSGVVQQASVGAPFTVGLVAASAIQGTATNDNATTGNIGEYVQASLALGSAISLTSNTPANITSISITAGDWDVDGVIQFVAAGSTVITYIGAGVSSASAALPAQGLIGRADNALTFPAGSTPNLYSGKVRFSRAGTTTIYLVGFALFSTSTLTAYGQIQARRAR